MNLKDVFIKFGYNWPRSPGEDENVNRRTSDRRLEGSSADLEGVPTSACLLSLWGLSNKDKRLFRRAAYFILYQIVHQVRQTK